MLAMEEFSDIPEEALVISVVEPTPAEVPLAAEELYDTTNGALKMTVAEVAAAVVTAAVSSEVLKGVRLAVGTMTL